MEANQEEAISHEEEAFDCLPGPDGENIVINMTTAKKSRHIRSQGQLEALKKAQIARKEKAVLRREEKSKPVAVPVSSPEEKPSKDYKAMYRAQKRELDELRFERAVYERVKEVTTSKPQEPTPVPAPTPPPKASIEDFMAMGWKTTGPPPRKKNVTSHW
jgi:hypothetical protein